MTTALRGLVLSAFVAATGLWLASTTRAEEVPPREPLALCPVVIESWSGQDLEPLDETTLKVLGADEYLNRLYATPNGGEVALFIGFYNSQRQGDTIHSPLNCLPGAGWTPVDTARIDVPIQNGTIGINRIVIEKGLDRQVVLYWYQSRGRVVASEYWGRFYLMMDAIRRNRTDGALVRVITPVLTTSDDAEREAVAFVQALFPLLHAHLPS